MPAHQNLSPQFRGLAPKIAEAMGSGGFSLHAPDVNRGVLRTADEVHPEGGFMVSAPGAEHVVKGTKAVDVEKYWGQHGKDQKDAYYGGWQDDGKDYHDVSVHHASFAEAKQAGVPSGQIAAYTLSGTPHPAREGSVRLHMAGFGDNDVDPKYRADGDPNKVTKADWSAPENKLPVAVNGGYPISLNDVYDSVNRNRAAKVRRSNSAKKGAKTRAENRAKNQG